MTLYHKQHSQDKSTYSHDQALPTNKKIMTLNINHKQCNARRKTYLDNHHGFTVMEIMIVVVIIAIALTLSYYSINIIFSANAESYADMYKSDLRYIKDQNMSTTSGNYYIEWKVVGTAISYEVYRDTIPIKTENIHRSVNVTYNGGSVDGQIVQFDPSDGTVIDGDGEYHFINNASGTDITVRLIQQTGRID